MAGLWRQRKRTLCAGLLTTSTLPTIFVPFNLADELDRIKIDDPGTPVVTSLKMYSWMRGACALSFACSLLCIVAAFAYIFLLQHKSADDYARFEVRGFCSRCFFVLLVQVSAFQFLAHPEFLAHPQLLSSSSSWCIHKRGRLLPN